MHSSLHAWLSIDRRRWRYLEMLGSDSKYDTLPMNEVALLDLRRCGVAQCGSDLGECASLEVLLLSENLLENLRGVEACQGRLWKLDARGNRISDLSAFAAFEHIGEVDLGANRLGYDELVKIAHVNINRDFAMIIDESINIDVLMRREMLIFIDEARKRID